MERRERDSEEDPEGDRSRAQTRRAGANRIAILREEKPPDPLRRIRSEHAAMLAGKGASGPSRRHAHAPRSDL